MLSHQRKLIMEMLLPNLAKMYSAFFYQDDCKQENLKNVLTLPLFQVRFKLVVVQGILVTE